MNNTPKISVIIPAYNAEKYLSETIDSVLAQTFQDWEMIIVDDGSSDRTLEIAQQYEKREHRIKIITQENQGGSNARANGFENSKAEYIYFLDADDIIESDTLERLYNALQGNNNAIVSYGSASFIDEKGEYINRKYDHVHTPPKSGDVFHDLLKTMFLATTGVALIRKSFLQQIPLHNNLKNAQDTVVWIRLATLGNFHYIDLPTVLRKRQHIDSVSKKNSVDAAVYFEYIDLLFSDPLIKAKLSDKEIEYYKRWRTFKCHRYVGRQLLCRRQFKQAQHHLFKALKMRFYDPITIILLISALLNWIPKPLAKEIGLGS